MSAPGADGGDVERLRRLLGGPDLAWLVERLRSRLEAGRALEGAVALRAATPAQRAAAARLFGTALRPGSSVSVRLADLEAELRRSGAWDGDLAGAVVALTGPVEVRAEVVAAARLAWSQAWEPVTAAVADHPLVECRDALRAWWDTELVTGTARRAAGSPAAAVPLARQLSRALLLLPARGVPIGALAHEATGSAHALDRGPLAGLVLRAARALAGPTHAASSDREVWAAVGVVRDEVSSTVLVLGVPAHERGATGRALAAWGLAGQPAVLTLRQLRLDPPAWRAPGPSQDGVVRVVENPVVLTAVADRSLASGVPAPPVVCTSGWPSAAAVAVLRGLRSAGWRLRHHGDLDADGLAIMEWLVREVGAEPWRMAAADYRAALAAGSGRAARVGALEASWDAELGQAMRVAQRVVEEEAVLDALVLEALGWREGP